MPRGYLQDIAGTVIDILWALAIHPARRRAEWSSFQLEFRVLEPRGSARSLQRC